MDQMRSFNPEPRNQFENNPLLTQLRFEFKESSDQLGDPKFFALAEKLYPSLLTDIFSVVQEENLMNQSKRLAVIYQKVGSLAPSSPEEQSAVQAMGRLTGALLQLIRVPSEFESIKNRIQELGVSKQKSELESREANELIQSHFNEYLLHSREVGHGKQGVVFYMDLEQAGQDFKNALVHKGVPVDASESAVKVLKIENTRAVEIEYQRQLIAYETVEKASKTKDYNGVRIPRPYLFTNLSLQPQVSERLSHYNCTLPHNTADVLMMDFIPGKDVEFFIFQEALRHKGIEIDNEMDPQELYHKTMIEFDFEMVGNAKDPALARRNNMVKVLHFLKQRGVRVNPELINKMKVGLRTLHVGNIYHGDLHEKNIMYTGSPKDFFSDSPGRVGELYFIDFGITGEEEVVPEKDFTVPNRLSELNK